MVSGTVTKTTRLIDGMTIVDVQGTGCENNDTRKIEVHDPVWDVSRGDSIWWQAHRAFVTSRASGEITELSMLWNS